MMDRFLRQPSPQVVLDGDVVEDIWADAISVLAESGVEMLDQQARTQLARAGASISSTRVRFDPGMVSEAIAKAPSIFELTSRNPRNEVLVGGNEAIASPVYGATHIIDNRGDRRRATLADLSYFHDLAQAAPSLQNAGSNIVEPADIDPALRHLHVMRSLLARSDKHVFAVTDSLDPAVSSLELTSVRARDSLAMARCAFGDAFGQKPSLAAVASSLEALTWRGVALEIIRSFAEAGQALIIAPVMVAGYNCPPQPVVLLTQLTAQILAAAVYAQIVRPSSPVVFAPHFLIPGKGSAMISAGADIQALILASGQISRRARLPFGAAGGVTGAKILDTQAGAEASSMLGTSVAAGAHLLLHSAGWLDAGRTISAAKFAFDALMLKELQRLHAAIEPIRAGIARAQLCGWGPGFDHRAHAGTVDLVSKFYASCPIADHDTWEDWQSAGSRDAATAAAAAVGEMVPDAVPLPADRVSALDDFVARRTAELIKQFRI